MNLNQKIAIVTGGASGFGAAIAQRMALAGASVMVADLNAEGASLIAEKIRAAGGQASSVAADVSDRTSFENMVARTRQDLGGLDILVNNAGTTHRNKPALEVTEEEFDRVYKVNVKSLFGQHKLCCQDSSSRAVAASSMSHPPRAFVLVRACLGTAAAKPP